jgi:hypothetical protein
MCYAVTHLTLDALLCDAFMNSLGRHGFYVRRRQDITLEAVTYCSQQGKLRLCRFLHFYALKTSKIAFFPDFTLKVPKITKGTI